MSFGPRAAPSGTWRKWALYLNGTPIRLYDTEQKAQEWLGKMLEHEAPDETYTVGEATVTSAVPPLTPPGT